MRARYIQDPITFKLVPADEYERPCASSAMIIPDIKPYRSMATGEIIGGRRQHREHLRQHQLIEIGNEKQKPAQRVPDKTIKRDVIDAVQRHWR